jgi:branched-subunit amino acid aminotransferase/4-amino-4-deoxychorismate lyase
MFAPHEARVSALDAGFLLGDGLFESLRAGGGVPYLLDRHLARLLSAAGELEFSDVPSGEELSEQVQRTLDGAEVEDAYVRVTVTRGSGAIALGSPPGPPTVVIAVLPAPPAQLGEGLEVTLIETPAELGAKAKSTSRQHAVAARRRVERRGAQEGLYVSPSGRILEGISSNVFIVAGGQLLTPPVEDCLPGITRGRLLELARGAGLTALEAPVEVDELIGADASFATNAVQGVRTIRALDGARLEGRDPAGVVTTLLDLYRADRAAAAR